MAEKPDVKAMEKIVKDLNCGIGAGKVRELDYSLLQMQQCKLKAKYRPGGKVYAKGGSGSSNSGQNKPKAGPSKNSRTPTKTQGSPRSMVVDGRTGKKRMVIDG